MIPLLCLASWLLGQTPAAPRFEKLDGSMEVIAPLSAARQTTVQVGKLTQDQGEAWLRVSVVDAKTGKAGPPMFGAYQRRGNDLVFRPRVGLEPGRLYRAEFGPEKESVTVDYRVPSQTAGRVPHVVKVYPTGDVLPANHLKFYIYYSQPMRGGQAMFKQIAIVDEEGKEVYDPWLHDEIWDEKTCCLILYIHPGRIKWGIALRDLLGPVLLPDRRYRLVVRGDMVDAEGTAIGKDYVKSFRTTAEDRQRIDLDAWKLATPTSGSRDLLAIQFGTVLDHKSLTSGLTVSDAAGKRVAGTIEIGKNEKVWNFRPDVAWSEQEHRLTVHPDLEDAAGNTPMRPFDMDLKASRIAAPRRYFTFRPVASSGGSANRR
jgi:hypothetical protein